MMRSLASWSMTSLASTSWPSTSPATVALAKPAPIDWATPSTDTGASNWRWEPSGRVIEIIGGWSGKRKKAPRRLSSAHQVGARSASAGSSGSGDGSAHVARSAGVAAGHLLDSLRRRSGPRLHSHGSGRGGRYRVRTCDPYHVKVVLYR